GRTGARAGLAAKTERLADQEVEAEPAAAAGPTLDELVSIRANLRRRPRPTPEPLPVRRSKLSEAAARRREVERRQETDAEQSVEDLLPAAAAALSPENATALVRELAELGGDEAEVVEAVEAASRADTTEERVAALEGVLRKDQGEPLNRTLLMKFLSSVRSLPRPREELRHVPEGRNQLGALLLERGLLTQAQLDAA